MKKRMHFLNACAFGCGLNEESAHAAQNLIVCSGEVFFFALFAPLRCALAPSLRGILCKMAVNFHCQTRYGNREKTHE